MAFLGAIRAGRGEVELGLNQTALELGIASAQSKLQSFAANVTAFGKTLALGGIFAGLKSLPVGYIFATYEQELANLRAALNPTAEQFTALRESIEKNARDLGENPADIAKAYVELAKAGVTLQTILNGAGRTAVMFGRLSGMSIAETAVVLADALNVFRADGLSANQVATQMIRGADSSSVSLRDMAEAISTAGATLAMYNQDLQTTTTLIGLLGNSAVKGAEAGTALKTFFMRLATGSDGAQAAMARLGLVVRDGAGNMLPAVEIIRRLGESIRGIEPEERDRLLGSLAGFRGIRALSVLIQEGAAGFNAFRDRMGRSLDLQQRFAIITDTLSGAFRRMWVSIQLAAIKIGDILMPAIRGAMVGIQGLFGVLEIIATDNPEVIRGFFLAALGLTAWGISLVVAGRALQIVALLMSPFISTLRVAQSALFSVTSSLVAFTVTAYMRGATALSIMASSAQYAFVALDKFNRAIMNAGVEVIKFAVYYVSYLSVAFYNASVAVLFSIGYIAKAMMLLMPSMSQVQRAINLVVLAFDYLVEFAAAGIGYLVRAIGTVVVAMWSMFPSIASIEKAINALVLLFSIMAEVVIRRVNSAITYLARNFTNFAFVVAETLLSAVELFFRMLMDLVYWLAITSVRTGAILFINKAIAISFLVLSNACVFLVNALNYLAIALEVAAKIAMGLIWVIAAIGPVVGAMLEALLKVPFLISVFQNLFNAMYSGLISAGLWIRSFVVSSIAWIRSLDIAFIALWIRQKFAALAMGIIAAASNVATFTISLMTGVMTALGVAGNFVVFTLGLYKVALIAASIAQTIATAGLSLLIGAMITIGIAVLTVTGAFLAVTGAAALFVSLGGSFAAIADWLEVIDDVIEFLADGFYEFIDAVMDSPVGDAIQFIADAAMELWDTIGDIADSFIEFLAVSGILETIENVFYALVGVAAVLASGIGLIGYALYLFFRDMTIAEFFGYFRMAIADIARAFTYVAAVIRPVITQLLDWFVDVFGYFISVGMDSVNTWSSAISRAGADISRQLIQWFNSAFSSISRSVSTIGDRFMAMIGRVANDIGVIWAAMQDAFSAGNWRLLWDIAVATFYIAWHEISAFAVDTFFALSDALTDVFRITAVAIQNIFTTIWSEVRSGFITMLADVLANLNQAQVARIFQALGVDLLGIGNVERQLRFQALDVRRVAGNDNRERNQALENNLGADEMIRWFRDQARAVENEMAGQGLRDELDALAMQAWFEAQAAQVQREIAGEVNNRAVPEGGQPPQAGISAIGTFSADVARGLFGAQAVSPQERAARAAEQQVRQMNEAVRLLQNIANRGGLVFVP